MFDKLLNFFYFNNHFKLATYSSKILSIFNSKYKKKIDFFNYFKKRKKKYSQENLKLLYQPKIFILKFSFNIDEILKQIYNYDKLYQKNQYTNDGHTNVYQSEHNLEKNDKFENLSNELQAFINQRLQDYIINNKLKISKLWFVITKKMGFIKKHSHFNSDFSGVFYLNVEETEERDGGLKIYNPMKNIEILKFSEDKNVFIKTVCTEKNFIFKPKKNDLIIFNSYLEHSVHNMSSKITDRISLPFDLIF
jgi:uncharacterized protein (TIGR02466 family)